MSELPEDVDALLAHERERDELSSHDIETMLGALRSNLERAPGAMAASSAKAMKSRSPWLERAAWSAIAVGAFVAGTVVGENRASVPPLPRSPVPAQSADVALPIVTSDLPSAPSGAPRASAAPTARSPRPIDSGVAAIARATAAVDAGTNAVSTLPDERALVEGARTALLRGRAADALALAQKHQALFATGELAEDRDFLIVSSLRELGRHEEARAKALEFHARYPKSALHDAIDP